MNEFMPQLIWLAGLGQFSVLTASALVPLRLDWRHQFQCLPPLHRQMYWVYGGYVVLSIVAFAFISLFNAAELAAGSGLARAFCGYVAVFWGIRLLLQGVLRVKPHLTTWWLTAGYYGLTLFFAFFTFVYAWSAFL